jgi:hypothetical protein
VLLVRRQRRKGRDGHGHAAAGGGGASRGDERDGAADPGTAARR